MEGASYPVLVHLKIPWLTQAFLYAFLVALVILAAFGMYLMPSNGAGNEMRAAYFVLTLNEFEKRMFVIGLLGTPVFFVLYRFVRVRRKGMLFLPPGRIEFDNFRFITSYAINEITDIACNDATTSDGFPKGKLRIDFRDREGKITSITLLDYSQSDEVMNTLLQYQTIRFNLTGFSIHPEILENN